MFFNLASFSLFLSLKYNLHVSFTFLLDTFEKKYAYIRNHHSTYKISE